MQTRRRILRLPAAAGDAMTGTQGLAVGAILSGVLTELLGKRWIVLISVPLIESVPIATSSLVR
ncbi:MAG: hypothetical protein L0G52_07940, partial [Brachybacterium sp.]|nr:hypothetical protein [Brachybacterium sp.]